jgi:UDP-glucose:(heptosyl)LPS alpha-1,3-glucosyltransferase
VSFLGSKTSVTPFLQQADTLIVPSTYDPFANVTLEALAMGLFVVSSKYNGASELLNKDNGVVIQNLYDPHDFAESLKIALSRPKTLQSAELIRSSVKHYSIENQLSKIIDGTLQDAS